MGRGLGVSVTFFMNLDIIFFFKSACLGWREREGGGGC